MSDDDAVADEAMSARDRERARQGRQVVRQFRLVYRAIQDHSRWVERQCGLSAAQLWALWELHRQPGMRVSELSRVLSIHQSTASNLLDKLEDKALIRRARAGDDHRVVQLLLTERGTELVTRAPRPAQGALSDALDRLPDAALGELTRALGALVAAMGVTDDEAALRPVAE